ncbi:CHAT domain-containing protein [Salinimicrobium soli]|uniref:CHAT domain-containing protein n=1 Tax=Salinimicrobium soli TaxID=1254399 RepID=UPI003AAAB87B
MELKAQEDSLPAKEVLSRFEKSYIRAKSVFQPGSKEIRDVAFELGKKIFFAGDHFRSINYFEESQKIFLQQNETFSKEYYLLLRDLSVAYYLTGSYEKALDSNLQNRELVKRLLGKESIEYGNILINLASISQYLQNYEATAQYLEELETLESSMQKSSDYDDLLYSMSVIFGELGNLNKSIVYLEKCLQNSLPDDGMITYKENQLSGLYYGSKDFDKAIEVHLKRLERTQHLEGKTSYEYISALHDLVKSYEAAGKYEAAIAAHQEALQLTGEVYGTAGFSYAYSLSKVAATHIYFDKYDDAIPILQEALQLFDREENENLYLLCQFYLGQAYFYDDQYSKAIEPLKASLTSAQGQDSYNLFLLSESYRKLQDFQEAIIFLDQAIEMAPVYNEKYLKNYSESKALLLQEMGRNEDALELVRKANSETLRDLETGFSFRSYSEKRALLDEVLYKFELQQSFGYRYQQSQELVEMNLNNTLVQKGLLLNSSRSILEDLATSNDTGVKNVLFEYNRLKEKITELEILGEDGDFRKQVEQQLGEQESQLSRYYNLKSQKNLSLNKSWKNIQENLKSDEVAIEFTYYQFHDSKQWTDSIFYGAYLITRDAAPRFISLFESRKLKDLMHQKSPEELYSLRGAVARSFKPSGLGELFNLIWAPLEPYLGDASRIYFAPDGLLHQVSFAALQDGKNESLSTKYELVQLSSTAVLAEPDEEKESRTAFLLIGGIDYGKGIDLEVKANKSRGESWNYLPGTRAEIENIAKILRKEKKQFSKLSGKEASEENFKQLSGTSPAVLHIATHGFFFEDQQRSRDTVATDRSKYFREAENPLLRSGLIFSGANFAWTGKDTPASLEDGILTALEISNLDLSGTALVVLSACETGLGDIEGSEGVFGLQRAFKMAGVDTIIMSLWQVPDLETAEFMQQFYEKYFEKRNFRKAFFETQRIMQKKYKDHPEKWAAFVMVE